jgi:hypothetical protein
MWMFSEIGFFSAVENYFEKDHVLVRGRFKRDLENLQQMIRDQELLELKLSVTPDHDYHYRLNVPKDVWGRVCQKLAEGITYHNFKNHVHGEPARDHAYMQCWMAMNGVQN